MVQTVVDTAFAVGHAIRNPPFCSSALVRQCDLDRPTVIGPNTRRNVPTGGQAIEHPAAPRHRQTHSPGKFTSADLSPFIQHDQAMKLCSGQAQLLLDLLLVALAFPFDRQDQLKESSAHATVYPLAVYLFMATIAISNNIKQETRLQVNLRLFERIHAECDRAWTLLSADSANAGGYNASEYQSCAK